MLQPKQFGSSFDGTRDGNQGIDSRSLERWRTSISPVTAKAFDMSHRRAYDILGYRDGVGAFQTEHVEL
jgi:hypothetical protein